jgi:hypothetical protein
MLVIILALQMWIKRENYQHIGKFIGSSLLGYGCGLLSFKMVMMNPVSSYVSNELPEFQNFIPNFISNLRKYYVYIKSDFKVEWLMLVILLLIAYVIVTVRISQQPKIITLFFTVLSLGAMGILCFGMYPALTTPLYYPRAMYGFGVWIALLGVMVASSNDLSVLKVPGILLSWSFYVFAFIYGNALNVQQEYTDFRILQVIDDLQELDFVQSDTSITAQVTGTIGYAPVLRNMPQDYQIMNRLVRVMFVGYWNWGICQISNYYDLRNMNWVYGLDLSGENLEVLSDTMYHTILGNDEYLLIELK